VEEAESMWRDVYAVTRRTATTSRAVRVVVESLQQVMAAPAQSRV
jgi:ABC-type branched-subunit amino acid transport system substrate-binding protein